MTTESTNNHHQEVIQWGYEYLSAHGFTFQNHLPEEVQHTPWSYVVRFITTDGFIYLKHTPALLALEAPIIQILDEKFQAFVPKMIAHNSELNSFLMYDAGISLRKYLKKQFDVTLFCKAIEQFSTLQIEVSDHINSFLAVGVPDWRIDKLSDRYQELLTQKAILFANEISEKEIYKLENLIPVINIRCKQLSAYAIKESIVQPDFQDNNLLIDPVSKKITLIDLGEISISHPFFALNNCLYTVKRHHGLTENDVIYQQLLDAALKNFLAFETKENLLQVLKLISSLWFVYEALAHYHLIIACGAEKIQQFYPGKLGNVLRKWLATMDAK